MSESHDEKSSVSYDRVETIDVPSDYYEKKIAIRYIDWRRCRRKINNIQTSIPRFHLIYSLLLGISASSGLSTVTISASQGLPAWVLPLYICVCIFSFIASIGFYLVDRMFIKQKKSLTNDLIEDLNDIESTFPSSFQER